jgi:hypothetical protein
MPDDERKEVSYDWQHGMAATNAADRREAEAAQAVKDAADEKRRVAWRERRRRL